MLKVVLANVNQSTLSHYLVEEVLIEKGPDMLSATRPIIYVTARSGWCIDTEGDIAILDVTGKIAWQVKSRSKGFIAIEMDTALHK